MENKTIQIDQQEYDILFTFRAPKGQLYLLLTSDDQVFAVRYEENADGAATVLPVSQNEIERILDAYNQTVADTYFYKNRTYTKQVQAAGMDLCTDGENERALYAFDPATRQPVCVDPAGKQFMSGIIQNILQENHEVVCQACPAVDDPDRIEGEALVRLDDVDIYLDYRLDQSGQLIFVENGRPIVRHDRQQEVLQLFRKWEAEQFEQAMDFEICDLV